MGTQNAYYVRCAAPEAAAALIKEVPAASTESGSDFFAVVLPLEHHRCPESHLQSLSGRLKTDVLWLQFQSAVDAFEFRHWRSGWPLRVLTYGCTEERVWERADGDAEAWESLALFSAEHLEFALEDAEDDEQRNEVRLEFEMRLLKLGSVRPSIEARETARKVAEYYRLPGWDLFTP